MIRWYWALAGLFLFFSAAALRFLPEVASQPVFSVVSVVLIALPSLFVLIRWLGLGGGLLVLGGLSLFAYLIEFLGLVSGFPYGQFLYSDLMGLKVFGLLPVLLPFAYVPLVLGAVALASRWSKKVLGRVILATGLLVFFDLVLDPGAVAIGLWSFSAGGWYYAVPVSNFLGWLVSASVASWLFFLLSEKQFVPPQLAVSAFLMLCFWTGVAAFFSLWIPFVLGSLLLVVLYRAS